MSSKKVILDRAIKQAKDLAASLKLIEGSIGTVPNAQKEAAFILARLETMRDLKFPESEFPESEIGQRVSNQIED